MTHRPRNSSSPTGHLEFHVKSYCKVRDAVFDLNHVVKGKGK